MDDFGCKIKLPSNTNFNHFFEGAAVGTPQYLYEFLKKLNGLSGPPHFPLIAKSITHKYVITSFKKMEPKQTHCDVFLITVNISLMF